MTDTQPAGEHHTGSLDLTGEGNAPEVSDALIAKMELAYWAAQEGEPVTNRCTAGMRAALTAAYSAIRQQVAEEIAARAEAMANEFQTTALDHRERSGDKETRKQQMHWRTAVAYRNKADGAWAVAAEIRCSGGTA